MPSRPTSSRRRLLAGGTAAALAASVIVTQASQSAGASTVSVDCDNGGTIAAAVAAAQPGDVINVSGTCEETVLVPRRLTGLVLDGKGTATIQGPAANTPATSPASFTLFIEAAGVTVKNFTILGGAHAVHLSGPALATIDSNTISDSGGAIHLDKGSIGQILNNRIEGNYYGINLQEDSYARIGFRIPTIPDAPGNIISNNTGPGITLTQRSNAMIVGNTITDNDGDGISVTRDSQADVMDNEIGGNAGNGITATYGSGINFSGEGTARPDDGPNTSATRNGGNGVNCSIDGYVAGPLGGLQGTKGPARITTGCVSAISR